MSLSSKEKRKTVPRSQIKISFKKRPIHFHTNSTALIRPVKQNKFSFNQQATTLCPEFFLHIKSAGRSLMHRKTAGPRMEPSRKTEYSCKDISFTTTKKRQNKTKDPTWNSITLAFVRRPVCQTLLKALDISHVTAWVTLTQFSSNSIRYILRTVRRCAVDHLFIFNLLQSDVKSCCKY